MKVLYQSKLNENKVENSNGITADGWHQLKFNLIKH